MNNGLNETIPEDAPKGERLQNILSHRGIASRRHAAELIAQGRVTVNGRVIREPGFRVDIERDEICFEGRPLQKEHEECHTVLLYKPRGVICSADNSRGQTVCDMMREFYTERLVPVGRLDKDTEGLLLLSNDGELCKLMTHPRYGFHKTYIVKVEGVLDRPRLDLLRSRMEIDGYLIQPVDVRVLKTGRDNIHRLQFTLTEGRNRQIRKMCEQAGLTVLELKRTRIGPLYIAAMKPGDFRELADSEIEMLKNKAHRNASGQKRPSSPPPDDGDRLGW
ncbi:MAG: rRNA pseudouridine synthase [Kiritimatiellae bacterium]|nr:rRNA pseudouridine synthase [Kiritimatiellia bacterium]